MYKYSYVSTQNVSWTIIPV